MITEKVFRKIRKAHRWLKKMRLHPISVYLFHQVSDVFDEGTMYRCDWSGTAQFKRNILKLKKMYKFITLEQAYYKIKTDYLRFRDYAVLTSDDGWASLKNVLPWLNEQGIPITLFLNPAYFDGIHFREREREKYLSSADIDGICSSYPLVSLGTHGWEHVNSTLLTVEQFEKSVIDSVSNLQEYGRFVPFYCYTWGKYNDETDKLLRKFDLIPVLIDGEKNVDDVKYIHRELLDGKTL